MNHSKLTTGELEQFQKIHFNLIFKNSRKKKFNTFSISKSGSKHHDKPRSLYTTIDPILLKSISILDNNNIDNYDKNTYYIEFHQRNCGFEKKPYGIFSWHQDDGGAVSYNVHTIIFYLRKDKTIQGGDLLYKDGSKEQKHIVNVGDIINFRGDLKHKPEETSGFGCRDIIVVFIKRTNNK